MNFKELERQSLVDSKARRQQMIDDGVVCDQIGRPGHIDWGYDKCETCRRQEEWIKAHPGTHVQQQWFEESVRRDNRNVNGFLAVVGIVVLWVWASHAISRAHRAGSARERRPISASSITGTERPVADVPVADNAPSKSRHRIDEA